MIRSFDYSFSFFYLYFTLFKVAIIIVFAEINVL